MGNPSAADFHAARCRYVYNQSFGRFAAVDAVVSGASLVYIEMLYTSVEWAYIVLSIAASRFVFALMLTGLAQARRPIKLFDQTSSHSIN